MTTIYDLLKGVDFFFNFFFLEESGGALFLEPRTQGMLEKLSLSLFMSLNSLYKKIIGFLSLKTATNEIEKVSFSVRIS